MVSKKTALSLNSPRPRLGHPWIRDTAFNPPSLNYCAILLSNAMQFFWFYFINPHPHPLHIFGDCVTLYCKVVRNINEKTLATYCTPSRMFSLFILIVVYFDNNWCHFLSPRKAILENILFSQFYEFLFLMDYKLNWPKSILDWGYNRG